MQIALDRIIIISQLSVVCVCTVHEGIYTKSGGDGAQMFQSKLGISAKTLKTIEWDDNVGGCSDMGAANGKRIAEIEQFHSIELNRIQMNWVDIFSSWFFECKEKSRFYFVWNNLSTRKLNGEHECFAKCTQSGRNIHFTRNERTRSIFMVPFKAKRSARKIRILKMKCVFLVCRCYPIFTCLICFY